MYHFFRTSSEPKVIGVRNGIYQAIFDKTCFSSKDGIKKYELLFSKGRVTRDEEQIKDVVSSIVRLDLMKTAKLTDFLQLCPYIPNVDFLISERLKIIFESCNLQNCYFYETTILDKKSNFGHPYYFFYHKWIPLEDIIFEKSELFSRKIEFEDGETKIKDTFYPLKSLEHYRNLKDSSFNFDFSKICVSSKYKGIDYIGVFTSTFLSEKLKNKLADSDITGIETGNRCELIFD